MPLPQQKIFTAKDYWNLPEDQRAELIDGQLYNMAPPSRLHQELVMELASTIRNYIKSHHGTCKVYPAPFAVDLNADDQTYVEPDISVICDSKKLTDRGCSGAPDFIIEIVSPSSRKMDYGKKMWLYMNAGVREYWIVDPSMKRTTLYRFEDTEAPMIVSFEHPIQMGIYPELKITIANLLE